MNPRSITLAMVCVGLSLCGAVSATGQDIKPAGDSRTASVQRGNRLLLIAPERFHAALGEFVRYKTQLLPTQLVSLEEVLRISSGVDDPERLKRYLYTQWREQQVGYVLLVGDVDVLPVRYMVLDRVTPQACDDAFYPADLYYSDLARQDGSFDDWNGQQESFHAGYFGEVRGEKNKQDAMNFDGVDYRPDIAVGRWPVSNEAEVQVVAAKTQVYETGVLADNKVGQDRAAVFVVGGWVDARGRVNHMVAYYYQHEQLEKLAPTADWYPASIFFQGMKFMLFGDPSLQLRTARDNK